MNSTNLAYLSAGQLAHMIRDGQSSAQELLELYLERTGRYNESVNAVVVFDADAARERAREADAALERGELWGPLHGVPMTVKECFEVVGMPATSGAPALTQHRPATNALAVQRLLDAGAVIYGKTNVPLYAGDLQSYNEVYGTTSNPWNTELTSGGSSGGAAAALAAGLTPLELGSDIGGSIRTPSAFCGVCGHKPSWGIVSTRGHIPGPPGTLSRADIGVAGPLARQVDDLELALDILAGPEPDDAQAWQLKLPAARRRRLADYRVAAWLDDEACPVEAEVVEVLSELVGTLRGEGVQIDEAARPEGVALASSHEIFYSLLTGALSAGFSDSQIERAQASAQRVDDANHYTARFARGVSQRHSDWLRSHEARERMRRAWAEFFSRFDVLLAPVVQTLPFPHDHSQPVGDRLLMVNGKPQPYLDILVWAGLAGGVYLPATVVPVGRSRAGLPIAVQIIGPYLEDRTTLDFARCLESLTGGFVPPPGYGAEQT